MQLWTAVTVEKHQQTYYSQSNNYQLKTNHQLYHHLQNKNLVYDLEIWT